MKTPHSQIIACIDGSILTESVCDYAHWIATKVDAPLNLLHTLNHHPENAVQTDFSGNLSLGSQEQLLKDISTLEQQQNQLKIQQGKLVLETAKAYLEKKGAEQLSNQQRHGDLIENVIDLEDNIRVLVLGLRGQVHQNQKNKIGAKLEAIIRALHRPILIVNEAFKQPECIMLAYDGSESADKAVDMVSKSPLFRGLNCHLVCVNKNEETAAELLEKAKNKLKSADNLVVIATKLTGVVDLALCNYQQQNNIDLTVMGAFSHTRLHELLLGSFTHKMLINTNKPLLLLR